MWNLRTRLSFLRRPAASSPDAEDGLTPELQQQVSAAFPRPEPSDALRGRVAEIVRAATETPHAAGSHPVRPGRELMSRRYRLALALTLALLFLLPFLTSRKGGHDAAYAAAPTAGQLALLDGQGRTSALCPLQHTDVVADVAGFVARVSVTQKFHNPSTGPVEAVYTFPLPADAAVDDMTMTIGDRIIRGEIKRKEEARRIYEEAQQEGRTAALLDQERPNIFTQSVANLMPGKDVSITISYVNLLPYQEGQYEFAFPMVVGPRFVPDSGGYQAPGLRGNPSSSRQADPNPGATSVVTDAEKITPPITPPGVRAGHDISLTVKLDAGVPLEEVKSELHAIQVDRDGPTHATVRLKDQNSIPNKDFILRYTVAGKEVKTGLLTHAEKGQGYFTLIFQPPTAPPAADVAPKEMVFVIDQTGSQSGWPIKKAKETMRYCIRKLNPQDTFQLIGFNTDVFPCFDAPVPSTPENVAKALKFLEPIEGEGGTDILKSVDYALKIPADPKRLRMICYLTDGYVGNDMQILDYIGKHRGTTRMFPMGIGNSVNRFLIDGMAREGRGAPAYVTLAEGTGEAAAEQFYHRVAQPVLLDPHVDWGNLPLADVFPKDIPDVFTAGPIIVKGRYTHAAEGDITISGLLRGQPWSQKVHVVLPADRAEDAALPTLWAREKIEELQRQDWLGAQTGHPNPHLTDEIVGVALDYRLMSQYTSFVAVEQRVVNLGGKQRTLDVPVEMPEGVSYEGIFGPAGGEVNDAKNAAGDGEKAVNGRAKARPNPFAPAGELKDVSPTTIAGVQQQQQVVDLGTPWHGYAQGLSTQSGANQMRAYQEMNDAALPQSQLFVSGRLPNGGMASEARRLANGSMASEARTAAPDTGVTYTGRPAFATAPQATSSSGRAGSFGSYGNRNAPGRRNGDMYASPSADGNHSGTGVPTVGLPVTDTPQSTRYLFGGHGNTTPLASDVYPAEDRLRVGDRSAVASAPQSYSSGKMTQRPPAPKSPLIMEPMSRSASAGANAAAARPSLPPPGNPPPANTPQFLDVDSAPAVVDPKPKPRRATTAPATTNSIAGNVTEQLLSHASNREPLGQPFNKGKGLNGAKSQAQRPRSGFVTMRIDDVAGSHTEVVAPDGGVSVDTLWKRGMILAAPLRAVAATGAVPTAHPELTVSGDQVAVQIWVARMPKDGLKKLQSLGLRDAVELRPGLVWVGMVPIKRLKELAALPWVFRVEPPKLR